MQWVEVGDVVEVTKMVSVESNKVKVMQLYKKGL